MTLRTLLIAAFIALNSIIALPLLAQNDTPVHPTVLGTGTLLGESLPLKDMPTLTDAEMQVLKEKGEAKVLNKKLRNREYPFAGTALPKGPDAAWQKTMGNAVTSKAPTINFDGQTSPYYPPDCNGTAGPNHYMQTINTTYAIYSKAGALLAGPTNMNLLFGSVTGANCNDGDPIILYDEQADRWLAVEFSLCGTNDRMLIAVSTTNNPTGTWYQYSFDVDDMPDYEKFGIWQDGYYMGDNNSATNDIYVFERAQMLVGAASPKMVAFNNPNRPTTIDGFVCVPPVDNDGAFAPAGAPGLFIAMNDDAIGGGSDQLWIYELAVNWTNTALSTFARTQQLNVTAFDSNFGNNWDNISQQGTTQKVDAIPQVILNVPQYRNFGSYQTIVCCHTVDVDATNHAGVRWYELRKTTGAWSVRQTGTYAPDANSRWMGSIMLNANNKIGLGYSVSSSTMYPSIRYTGQTAGAYAAGNGVMDVPEDIIQTGANSQTGANRWGDYSLMSVDPSDNETFWFTDEYIGSGGSRKTKIASFKIGNAPVAITLDATAVTSSAATLNGTINPNSLATNYYFEWGTSVSYGNTTTITAAGSGSANVAASANISGLTGGTTYHFRVVATNSDGTTNGADLTFTPGGAVVTTTAVTGITLTGAASGGNVTSDGGSSISVRGVCWATTANPVATGNHTTDGAGTGVFTSTIPGLSANTTYHVRAYATNANGTFYGADIAFTTLCGIYSLPFNETFSATTIPTCWSQVDNQGSGQVWQFGTFSTPTPVPVLTGNYAFLNSDGYGSGNSQNADLVTPTIDMSGYSAVNLAFSHFFRFYAGSSATLSYSINNGTTWTTIQTYSATTANPASFSQSIPAVAGQSAVKFKWNYTGTYGYCWAIDNVAITGTGVVTLSVTPSNQNVTPPAGTTPFAVTTTAAWTATSDAAWCTVTPSGTGNGTLTATYTQNLSAASRVANITVSASGATPVTVTVTQSGTSPTLSVTPPNQNVTAPAGNTSFTVTSNSAWTVTSDAAWCVPTASGTGNGTIAAAYTQNILLTGRTANITVTVTGLTPVVVTVTQAAGSPILAVTPANQNVSASAGNTNFTVTSNSAWTTSSNAAWCTLTPSGTGNGTLVATYTANALPTSRIATVTVTVIGITPVTVTVTQSGISPTLSVTPPNQDVTSPAGNTSFSVTSNSAWTVVSDAGWCTVTPSGSGNGTLIATYQENTLLPARTANVTVTVAGLSPVVVTVTQAGTVPTLIVTPLNQNVPATAGSANYTVTTNAAWAATSGTFWCNVTPSGNGNGTMVATYGANTSLDQRITYIAVSVPGAPNANVTLTQAGAAPFLSVDPHIQNVGVSAGTVNFAVSSNMPWTATSNSPWCAVTTSGNGNGTVVATYTENAFASNRTASITVSASGIVPIIVTVVQGGPVATLSVTPATRTVTDPAGSTTFNVSANTTWSVSSDANWCQTNTSGTGIGLITAIYQQNLTPVMRTANIQVLGAGTAPASVQVLQLPSFVSIEESPESGLQVFPNPTSGVFAISGASSEMFEMKISILDAKGKTILARQYKGANSYSFDLSQAASGNYFLKVETGDKTHLLKLIVQ
ncbi:MAG: BACON domain-containing carbohydrate-binding protein [Bacteroidota bacterium]